MEIRMSAPDLTDADRQAVLNVINSPVLSMGQYTRDFEKAFCDLTGAKQSSKVARAANDARGRTTNYYRDQWLNFKAKLYDGNVMRVSAIQRVKERNGYWGRGKVSGKSKWKPAKFKGAYQELKVRIAVNPEVYSIARNNEIKPKTHVGEYTINAVDTEGGLVTVLASSPNENVSSESVLGVMKFAYEMLKLKKA